MLRKTTFYQVKMERDRFQTRHALCKGTKADVTAHALGGASKQPSQTQIRTKQAAINKAQETEQT